MELYIEFIKQEWMLFASLAAISALLIQNLLTGGAKNNVEPIAATEMINREDAVVVDVRPINDFSQGHVIGALNIPLGSLKNQLGQLEKQKQKPVIVACRSGSQSAAACKQLSSAGFESVYNLKGGMMAWSSANLPISRKK
ncbi:MAG: rhodanese-like domain-containing protein [Candidatus Sedimenticola sp. (ex Thyasira tokunagai)]